MYEAIWGGGCVFEIVQAQIASPRSCLRIQCCWLFEASVLAHDLERLIWIWWDPMVWRWESMVSPLGLGVLDWQESNMRQINCKRAGSNPGPLRLTPYHALPCQLNCMLQLLKKYQEIYILNTISISERLRSSSSGRLLRLSLQSKPTK